MEVEPSECGKVKVKDGEEIRRSPVNVGVVVSGEASESDEEETVVCSTADIPPLHVQRQSNAIPQDLPKQSVKSKHDSLLHRKLRERNAALEEGVRDTIGQMYVMTSSHMTAICHSLARTENVVRGVSSKMSQLTNDLFHLEDKVDIITSCTILPDIMLPAEGQQT